MKGEGRGVGEGGGFCDVIFNCCPSLEFSSPLTDNMTGSSLFPAKIENDVTETSSPSPSSTLSFHTS